MKIAITGHRPKVLGWGYDYSSSNYRELSEELENIIIDCIKDTEEQIEIISGMALGVDIVFALVAIKLKQEGHDVKLHCVIPFKGQENKWFKEDRELYKSILNEADKATYVCDEGYASWKMQKRNEFMVDRCDMLIAVWNGKKSGTGNCVEYAKKKNREVIFLNPHSYEN